MEAELDLLLGTAINSLLKLETLLYFRARPGTAQSPNEISTKLGRSLPEVRAALDQLADTGLVDRFPLGSGKHAVYGPTEDRHVEKIIDLLHEHYHRDQANRSLIIRKALHGRGEDEARTASDIPRPDSAVGTDGT